MFNQFDKQETLKKIAEGRKQGTDSCARSGVCCWSRPGRLTREDLKRLAEHKEISEAEFFSLYCAVDELPELCVILRRHHQQGGQWITSEETWSLKTPCVFFDDSTRECNIHSVKPQECTIFRCWEPRPDDSFIAHAWTEQEILGLGWDGKREE